MHQRRRGEARGDADAMVSRGSAVHRDVPGRRRGRGEATPKTHGVSKRQQREGRSRSPPALLRVVIATTERAEVRT